MTLLPGSADTGDDSGGEDSPDVSEAGAYTSTFQLNLSRF
jgi:hypothetical protein